MAMTCSGRASARSLPTLVLTAARCSVFNSLPISSIACSSISSSPGDDFAHSRIQRGSDLRVLSPALRGEVGEALASVAQLGRAVDENATEAKSRTFQTYLSYTASRRNPLTEIGGSLRHLTASCAGGTFSRQEVARGCALAVEPQSWITHSPSYRDGQAKQLRHIYTSSSGYRAASPPCADISLEVDLLGIHNQDKLDPFALVADELTLLGHRLRDMVTAEVPTLSEAAEYFFKQGVEGKRFRPMVLLLLASSMTSLSPSKGLDYGEQKLEDVLEEERRVKQQRIAEITEMIHVASLLHDDVLDHADTRRGIGSLNSLMGNKLAVLAGDFLLARASVSLASLKNTDVVDLLSRVLEHLVTGEIMQLTSNTEELCSMEYYLQKTFYKTASLMANSCKSIALLANQPQDVAELAFEYGRHLGLAYQLVDDALDFIGTKASLGKPALNDIAQGIATAPILFALEEHPQLYNLAKRKFRKSGDIEAAQEMVNSSQGILRTKQLAAYHAQQAALAIGGLPASSSQRGQLCRRALTELTQTVITRSK